LEYFGTLGSSFLNWRIYNLGILLGKFKNLGSHWGNYKIASIGKWNTKLGIPLGKI
jgi:hypothetical protein